MTNHKEKDSGVREAQSLENKLKDEKISKKEKADMEKEQKSAKKEMKSIFKKNKKKNDYFAMLAEAGDYCLEAATKLDEIVRHFDPEKLEELSAQMHDIEHKADYAHHQLSEKLSKEFIPPIEREDIAALGDEIDDVVDALEDVVVRFHIFNIRELREEAAAFSSIILKQNQTLSELIHEFRHFKKSKNLKKLIVEVNRLEEEADSVYFSAIHRLFMEEKDPIKVLAWTEIFRRMEASCDYAEDVSQLVETVIMKNS